MIYRAAVTRIVPTEGIYFEVPELAVGYEFGPSPYRSDVRLNDYVIVAQVGDNKEDLEIVQNPWNGLSSGGGGAGIGQVPTPADLPADDIDYEIVYVDSTGLTYIWSGTEWVGTHDQTALNAADAAVAAQSAAVAASDKADDALTEAQLAKAIADGYIRTYYSNTAPWANGSSEPPSSVGDIWFNTTTDVASRWNGANWIDAEDSALVEALRAAQDAKTTADGKITSYYLPEEPVVGELGDLWFDTNDLNKPYYCSNVSPLTWTLVRDGGITIAQAAAEQAQQTADDKSKTYTVPTAPLGLTADDDGDIWYDSDDRNKPYKWNGTTLEWEELVIPSTSVTGDGVAPATSPTPVVASLGYTGLLIKWDKVANADLTKYRVYLDTVSPPVQVLTETAGLMAATSVLANGTGLVPGTTYYAQIQAFDTDGDGPRSAVVSGTPVVVPADAVAAEVLVVNELFTREGYFGTVSADQIVGRELTAALAIVGGLSVGPGITITQDDGIQIATPSGVTQFPTDGSDIKLTADVIATAMTIMGSLSIRGTNNEVSKGATINLASGVTPPKAAPAVSSYYPQEAIHDGYSNVGLVYHATQDRWLSTESLFGTAIVQHYNNGSTRFAHAFENFTLHTDGGRSEIQNGEGGICLIGNRAYVLCQTSEKWANTFLGRWYVYMWDYNASWTMNANRWTYAGRWAFLNPTDDGNTTASSKSPYSPIIGTNGTNIFIIQAEANTGLHWRYTYTPSGTKTSQGYLRNYDNSGFERKRDCSGLIVGSFDFGSERFLITHTNYPWVYNFKTSDSKRVGTGNSEADLYDEFPTPGTPVEGIAVDPTDPNNSLITRSNNTVTTYSGIKDSDLNTSALNIVYTWMSKSGGAIKTGETTPSPVFKTSTFSRRAWLRVTAPPIPGDYPATISDPSDIAVYVGRGGAPALSTYKDASTTTYWTNIASKKNDIVYRLLPVSGSAPPTTTSGFASGVPAKVTSDVQDGLGPLVVIAGDGTNRMGEVATDAAGKTSYKVPHIRRALSNAMTATNNTDTLIPFNSTQGASFEITTPSNGVFQVNRTGIYTITLQLNFTGNGSGYRAAFMYIDGSNALANRAAATPAGAWSGVPLAIDMYLIAGQQVSFYAWQNSGAGLSVVANGRDTQVSFTYKGTV